MGYRVINFKCPSIINSFFQKKKNSKLRLINRGYKQLQDSNRLALILKLKNVLTKTELKSVKIHNIFLGKNNLDIGLSVRQYLTVRLLGISFNKAILYSVGSEKPLRHPLPSEWRNALISEKIQVDNFSCALLWYGYVILLWGYGVLQWLKNFWSIFYKCPDLGNYIYFHGLSKDNISHDAKVHNIVNWYLQWKNKNKNINSICHSVNGLSNFKYNGLNIVNTDGLPKLKGRQIMYYYLYSIYLIIYSFIMIFIKPYNGLMLGEILKLVRTSFASKDQLASDYMFHNSGPYYRPIWTYEAHRKGSRILFYFYSTNNENFKNVDVDGYPLQNPWHLISWPYYLVWDRYQADFLKKNNGYDLVIEEVGQIWFSSDNAKLPIFPKTSFSIFDVQPMRSSYYMTLGLDNDFYKGNVANQFLNDIQLVLESNQITLLHKRKRASLFVNKKYKSNLKRMTKKLNYIEMPVDIDATQIIQKTKACISMPFTSTALIAKLEGKPSVYYDPYGTIQKDDPAAHGIPILSGVDELNAWVRNLSNE
jgi:polysaccharide biosynthesis PFTS motif protein